MEYIPDYLKPFIIHKDYFPELIEDSWFNNPVYWKGRLISPQNETKFKLYFCGELIDNSIVGKQTSPLAIYADSAAGDTRKPAVCPCRNVCRPYFSNRLCCPPYLLVQLRPTPSAERHKACPQETFTRPMAAELL